jgi:hypothetical protein
LPHKGPDQAIREALLKIKEAIANKRFVVLPTKKNREFLAKNGMHPRERVSVIGHLQVANYDSGPERDYGSTSADLNIWIFKKRVLQHEIYIKIKLIEGEDIFVKCLSFHD